MEQGVVCMTYYHTSICAILWLSLAIISVLAHEDERLPRARKCRYYVTNAVIALAILAEWAGAMLDGVMGVPVWTLRLVACADHVLAPAIGAALVAQLRIHSRWNQVLYASIVANAALQIASVPTGWMLTVDAANRCSHGPLFVVYLAAVAIVVIIVLVELLRYGRSFKRQNRLSLYATAALVVAGVVAQEVSGGAARCAYVAIVLGNALLYIHFSEFSQQRTDEEVGELRAQVTTDALTGLLSRRAWEDESASLSAAGPLPEDLCVYSVDVNGLKEANDGLGHDAGDELLRGAAQVILGAFADYGQCYRTGGDEFVVLAIADVSTAQEGLRRLKEEAARWRGESVGGLSLSVGYAVAGEHEGVSLDGLTALADRMMYVDKAAYYRTFGHNRRRR
jgi:diguanylate cyclase (GGDEF)-like protein